MLTTAISASGLSHVVRSTIGYHNNSGASRIESVTRRYFHVYSLFW